MDRGSKKYCLLSSRKKWLIKAISLFIIGIQGSVLNGVPPFSPKQSGGVGHIDGVFPKCPLISMVLIRKHLSQRANIGLQG